MRHTETDTRQPLPVRLDHARTSGRRAAALACVLVLAGCGEAGPATGDPPLDELPAWVLVEELRLGSRDDPERGFSRVTSLDVDRDGRIYVAEAQDLQIRVFSPEGEPLVRLGGRGEGPGEFQSPPRFGVVGDTVWAFDMMGDRITLFHRDGALISARRAQALLLPLSSANGHLLPWIMRDDGLFVSSLSRVSGLQPGGLGDGVQPARLRVPRVLFDVAGDVVDTIGWDSSPPPRMVPPPGHRSSLEWVTVGERRYMVPGPPSTLPLWIPLADGRIVVDAGTASAAEQGTLTVTRLGLDEDTLYHRTLRYAPEAYTSADLDSIAARGARGVGLAIAVPGRAPQIPDDVDAVANRLRAAMSFPSHRPRIRSAWTTEDEAVWLRFDDFDPSRSRWAVLDVEGIPRAQVELARGARPLWARGDVVWVLEPDEFDVPWLVRYRARDG